MKKYIVLLLTFLKLGLFTFGGGYNMIPLLENELVDSKRWITREDFYNYFALETIVPGSVAVNMASFIGYHKYKLPGLLIATLGVILPSIIIIAFLSYYIFKYKENVYTKKVIFTLKSTVLALIFITFLTLFKNTVKTYNKLSEYNFKILFFFILTFILIFYLNYNPIHVILFNLIIGLLL